VILRVALCIPTTILVSSNVLDTEQGRFFPSKKFNMAEDFDVEAMLEAPYQKNVSGLIDLQLLNIAIKLSDGLYQLCY